MGWIFQSYTFHPPENVKKNYKVNSTNNKVVYTGFGQHQAIYIEHKQGFFSTL